MSLLGSFMLAAAVSAADPHVQGIVQDSTYGCIICHADKRRAFAQGVHAERGIRCHDCHGGDPTQYEVGPAHRRGFAGSLDKRATVRLCASCHSDPNQMRQYGLAADQLAEFRTSRHGQLLLEQGNSDAPTCTDCHEAHTIRRANDARSMVHPTNIPETCGSCHEDAGLMAKYGIPADQLEHYREGAHGEALYVEGNLASPTCIGCHGSHAALPPTVTEIAQVCGHCHQLMAQAFYAGPHGVPSMAGELPGCLGCHSTHGTARIPPDQVDELCTSCHDADSSVPALATEIEEEILKARAELDAARTSIAAMESVGRSAADERFRYLAAYTAYRQFGRAQHALDLGEMAELGRQVRSNTGIIDATAEAYAEERWEHKLLLVPVWFLALSALALALFKLRELER